MKVSLSRIIGASLALLCLSTSLQAQHLQKYLRQYDKQLMEEYVQFLSIPNVSTDSVNIRKNAAFIQEMMNRKGIKAELLNGTTTGVTPAVFGEIKTPGATKTIGFYAHYDGQPVNPKQWYAGTDPFKPVLITAPLESGGKIMGPYQAGEPVNPAWRILGRGSADDKAGVMAILNAYEALVKTSQRLNANIKFLFEGEEEVGSIHLNEIFRQHKAKLQADCWIIIDAPRHVSGRKTLIYGVRGDVNMALTVYGPKRPLHSGNYGNWAPNPALKLAQLLASMKDEHGKVLVKGFYDDVTPLTATEKQALAQIPNQDETLKKELGVNAPEVATRSLVESIMQPTLNINGLHSANVGSMASNVIPTKAEAVLDLRLVKGNDFRKQVEKVIAHIKAKGFQVLDREPTEEDRRNYPNLIKIEVEHGYNAQRTPMDLPIAKSIQVAVQSTTKEPLVLIPSMGGSLPLYLFEEILGTKVITVPIVNYDNNQHAENENVKIQYLWEGIETIAAIMQARF
ncbi:M20/M25/M40 family metallo-hydrolase [Rufibacter sediminis]|uniref:M20/M25/M40 family metallo-hydrolase n=1 Tax=Rufibacter sediminis TaxID=2762756 RepID=A0ABR6VTS2_9BACT|nr:M20/M25/M40 family metallo-hydrolase [Rufibacter sediminis]MBC3540603.1 M20/M25/M40 family metallo-hydrolase [Rufibacter sediminis]